MAIGGSSSCCPFTTKGTCIDSQDRTLAAGGGAASPEGGGEAAVRAQAAEANAHGRRPEGRPARQAGHGAAARLAHRVDALNVVALSAADRRILDVLRVAASSLTCVGGFAGSADFVPESDPRCHSGYER